MCCGAPSPSPSCSPCSCGRATATGLTSAWCGRSASPSCPTTTWTRVSEQSAFLPLCLPSPLLLTRWREYRWLFGCRLLSLNDVDQELEESCGCHVLVAQLHGSLPRIMASCTQLLCSSVAWTDSADRRVLSELRRSQKYVRKQKRKSNLNHLLTLLTVAITFPIVIKIILLLFLCIFLV